MNQHSDFRNRLLASEQVDVKRRERYQMEVQRILSSTFRWAMRTVAGLVAVLALAFALLCAGFSLFIAAKGMLDNYPYLSILLAVVFLVIHSLIVIQRLVKQSELNIREKLLEIELKIAEMNEALAGKQG
jgi:hypothetical protein